MYADIIGVGGGGGGGRFALCPQTFWKPEIRVKCVTVENSGKKWRKIIKKGQQQIRAKLGRKFGQKAEGKKLRNDSKKIRATSLEENEKLIVFLSP